MGCKPAGYLHAQPKDCRETIHFQKCSGLEATDKSKSANTNNSLDSLDIAWPKDPIFVPGTPFSYGEEAAFQKNFEQKLSSIVFLLNL